jgi:hypothetical protein
MKFRIKPITLIQNIICEEIHISGVSVDRAELLGQTGSASCRIQLIAKDRPDIRPKQRVTMTGEDYSNWNNDDKYFFDKVASYVGAEIIWDDESEKPSL